MCSDFPGYGTYQGFALDPLQMLRVPPWPPDRFNQP